MELDVTPEYVAEIVAAVAVATAVVVTVKLALPEPKSTNTVAGMLVTDGLLLDSVRVRPFDGAGPFRATVAWLAVPPTTLDGLSVTEETDGGCTVSVADLKLDPYDAPTVDDEDDPTAAVETVNVVVSEPAGTVMMDGTVATDVLLEDRFTLAPPVGAAPFKATVA